MGIPLETFRVDGKGGNRIAAYRFVEIDSETAISQRPRTIIPKEVKKNLIERDGAICSICHGEFPPNVLQVDHRVPFIVAGDAEAFDKHLGAYQLICGSCNRAKSWSCEHCANTLSGKDHRKCLSCYWASPTNYIHIALADIRRVDLTWTKDELSAYLHIERLAVKAKQSVREYIKNRLKSP